MPKHVAHAVEYREFEVSGIDVASNYRKSRTVRFMDTLDHVITYIVSLILGLCHTAMTNSGKSHVIIKIRV